LPPLANDAVQLEHELEILRDRYGRMQYWAKVTKRVVFAGMVVIVAIGVYAIVVGEAVAAFAAAMAIVAFLFLTIWPPRDLRWIDLISSPVAPLQTPNRMRSEAREIEVMIAQREARLAALAPRK
jgi:hypothetical protein